MWTKSRSTELCAKPFLSHLPPFSKNGFFAKCPRDHRAWRHRDYVDKILPPSHSVRKSKRQNGRFVHVILVGAIPQNWGTHFCMLWTRCSGFNSSWSCLAAEIQPDCEPADRTFCPLVRLLRASGPLCGQSPHAGRSALRA